jgi:ubiquinone/menaquinone biosynthesis C-methylase UbiE
VTEDKNWKTYASPGVVNHYAKLSLLQPAEKTVLDLLQNQLSSMKMLDIGVGGGRTTKHFSQAAAEYIGIDYSVDMVTVCKKRFAASSQTMQFEVCDARDMSQFQDDSFDFILFSFNGIDYISNSDRLQVFQEISRLGKSGGYLFFSTHNIQAIEREFDLTKQFSCNPIRTYVNLVMLVLLRCFNFPMTLSYLKASNYAIIRDESHNFRLKTHYIRPQEQINQLETSFSDVKVYSWSNGLEIKNNDELSANSDMWLYYLCTFQ